MRTLLLMGGVFVIAYPFLNLYRSAIALGIAPGDLIAAIAKMYASERAASDFILSQCPGKLLFPPSSGALWGTTHS